MTAFRTSAILVFCALHLAAQAPAQTAAKKAGTSTAAAPRVVHAANGSTLTYGPRGELRDIHAKNLDIHRGPSGERTIRTERPDHTVLVTNSAGHGYIQRPFLAGDQEFLARTYNTARGSRIYRPSMYRTTPVNVYVPDLFQTPGFYGWAYVPFLSPVFYSWSFQGPWLAASRGYFAPSQSQVSASAWLAEYVLATVIESGYQEQIDAGATPKPSAIDPTALPGLTSEVRINLAEEIQRHIAYENQEADSATQDPPLPGPIGLTRMLRDNTTHMFVVSNPLNVTSAGRECILTPGDVLQLQGTASFAAMFDVTVVASHPQDCKRAAIVSLGPADLQEMQSRLHEAMDQGIAELRTQLGQNGLPEPPRSVTGETVKPTYLATAPPPYPNLDAELKQLAQTGVQAEKDLTRVPAKPK